MSTDGLKIILIAIISLIVILILVLVAIYYKDKLAKKREEEEQAPKNDEEIKQDKKSVFRYFISNYFLGELQYHFLLIDRIYKFQILE